MLPRSKSVFLADDDVDDCLLFEDALREIPISTRLTIAHDGVELMQMLSDAPEDLPDTLFLDLNMPLKNGFQCLAEIKRSEKLKLIEVIILSTSFNRDDAYRLFNAGASHCILKPNDFNMLKGLLLQLLNTPEENLLMTSSETEKIKKFILSP
jgi:CheY-like chemotaxis protein